MLEFYNENQESYGSITENTHSDKLRTTHNGKIGGTFDKLFYIKNNDPTVYYTSINITPVSTTYDNVNGVWSETGFGVKLLYGERQPTELEWDQVMPGESIAIPDIGYSESADVANYFPVWIRTIVPGKTAAQKKSNISLKCSYLTKQLGT